MSRLVETTLHLINEKHAWATEALDSLVDAHRRSVTDVPVGLLSLAIGRLAEDGEAR